MIENNPSVTLYWYAQTTVIYVTIRTSVLPCVYTHNVQSVYACYNQHMKMDYVTAFLWFTVTIHHHHRILLLLVEHGASMKSFRALRSPAVPLTSFHDLPVFLLSSSVVLRHVLFGLPLLLYPWGFQSNAVFSIVLASLRNVCPIQFHFLLFIWFSINFCWVILHNSSFVILSVHFIFIIRLKLLFTNICNLLVIWLVSVLIA